MRKRSSMRKSIIYVNKIAFNGLIVLLENGSQAGDFLSTCNTLGTG